MSFIKKFITWSVDKANSADINRAVRESVSLYKNKVNELGCSLSDEEKEQVDALYLKYFGKKGEYCYHNLFKYYGKEFNPLYFPDDLGRCKLSAYANDKNFVESVSDKLFLYNIGAAAGINMPRLLLASSQGLYFDGDMNILTKAEAVDILMNSIDYIVKPSVESGCSAGCLFISSREYDRVGRKQAEDILNDFGTDFIVQSIINQHNSIEIVNPGSFSSIRFITYVINGTIKSTPAILMMGTGSSKTSNAKGFIYVGINEDGTLYDYAVNKSGVLDIDRHPDSGFIFSGHKIDGFKDVVKEALYVHRFMPRVGVINWDYTVDNNGSPVLIEANCRNGNGIFLIQSATGLPIFGEDTGYIMDWIKRADDLGKTKRYNQRIHM